MKFGEYLRKRRKHYGMSQEELAFDLGVIQNTVSSWEREVTSPPFDFALDIMARFGDEVQIVQKFD